MTRMTRMGRPLLMRLVTSGILCGPFASFASSAAKNLRKNPRNAALCSQRVMVMRLNACFLAAGLASVFAAAPLVAHHSFAAEYDSGRPIKFTGTVSKVEWMNPHIHYYVDGKEADGKVTN